MQENRKRHKKEASEQLDANSSSKRVVVGSNPTGSLRSKDTMGQLVYSVRLLTFGEKSLAGSNPAGVDYSFSL